MIDRSEQRELARLRRDLLAREERHLSPLAARSAEAVRPRPEEASSFRPEYLRDLGRVKYAEYLRKLANKTQSIIDQFDAVIHTRYSHSQEVAHIAKTLARGLRLNEDLAEAAALAHDLGHTPFGHAGEAALDGLTGHFKHYEQSLRVVDFLEKGRGLNLTNAVRDAILNHSKGKGPMVGGHSAPATLEGWCVRWADPIAYLVHDIEDCLRLGELTEDDLPSYTIRVLGQSADSRLSALIRNLILSGRRFTVRPDPELVRAYRAGEITLALELTGEVAQAFEELRTFMYERIYSSERKKRAERQVNEIIDALFNYYTENPVALPEPFVRGGRERGETTERVITDYIASLTDREAQKLYAELAKSKPRFHAIAV